MVERPEREPLVLRRWSGRWLVAAFVAVIALFVVAMGAAQRSAHTIGGASASIATNAAPSIASLSTARGAMREVARMLDREADAGLQGRAPPRRALLSAIDRMEAALRAHDASPRYPEEQALAQTFDRHVAAVRDAVARAMAELDQRRYGAARAIIDDELRDAIERATTAATQLVNLNAWHVADLAAQIERTRDASGRLALGLTAVSVALSAALAALALRVVRRYEDALRAQTTAADARAAELEVFARRVAHDVAGPLTAVGLALDAVERRGRGDGVTSATIARGRSSLKRVVAIVDALLDFARSGAQPERGLSTPVDATLDGVVEEIRPVAEAARVELVVEPHPACAVDCRPGVLTSLVSNLVRNAIKYMGDARTRRVSVRVAPRDDVVRVEVEDTGPGLAPGASETIFEPYVRAAGSSTQPGLGLGLATVRRLTQAHGGAAGVRSSLGRGSVFWFELPRARLSEPSPARLPDEPEAPRGDERDRGDALAGAARRPSRDGRADEPARPRGGGAGALARA